MASSILIVTPYAAAANNGNWRTAERWAQLLRPDHRVIVRTVDEALEPAELLIALHARRSHPAIARWREQLPGRPCVLVLTGTDLYRDIAHGHNKALRSLEWADRLVVLQQRALAALPASARAKANVVYQSAPALPPFRKSGRSLRALFVGHMRREKDPITFLRAAARLAHRSDIELALAGGMRDETLHRPVERLLARAPSVAMLGALEHRAARERIRRAHILIVPSRMEGGANVVVEAVTAGTPVLASDCDGNVGMLGERYPGYFPVGNAAALADLIARCRDEPAYLRRLSALCRARSALFSPQSERRALLRAVDSVRRGR